MKNVIKYYYGIDVDKIIQKEKNYQFSKNNIFFVLTCLDRDDEELLEIYDLINKLHKLGLFCHKIIPNLNNGLSIMVNNKKYVLMRKYILSEDPITLGDIIKFSEISTFNFEYKKINRSNWKGLWEQKIDYFEYQLSMVGKKYPNLASSFGYYAGITENAIQLIDIYNDLVDASICVSHKRILYDTTLDEFYNPLNFIIDYKVRDIAEYIKQRHNILDIDSDITYLFNRFILKNNDKILFLIRIIFPSFYFDVYEKIIDGKFNDNNLLYILNNRHERLIKKIYEKINTYINIFNIEWLTLN